MRCRVELLPTVALHAHIFDKIDARFEPVSTHKLREFGGECCVTQLLAQILGDGLSGQRAGHCRCFSLDQSRIQALQLSCVALDLLLEQLQGVIDSGFTGKILQTSLHDLIDRVQRWPSSLAQIRRPSSEALMQTIEQSM